MSAYRFIFLIILLLIYSGLKSQDDYVVAFGKLKVEWGNTDNTKITLYEDGKEIDSYRPEKSGKFQFTLELNHMYMFWFEKSGHVTKKVQFNTAVPKSVTSDPEFIPFPDFDFYVTLFKSYPEVDTMFFSKPVGKIQYSAQKNDFDWDKNYTLEIQRRMEEIEKEIREKHEEKLRQDQEAEDLAIQQEIEAEEAKKEAEKQAQLEKERQEKEAKEREKEEKRLAALEEEKRKQEEKDREKAEREAEELAKQQEIEAKQAKMQEEKQAQSEKERQEKEEKRLADIEKEKRKQEEKDREKEERETSKQAAINAKNAEKENEEQERLANNAKVEQIIAEENKREEKKNEVKNVEIPQKVNIEESKSISNLPKPTVVQQNKSANKPTYGRTVVKKTQPIRNQVDKVEVAGRTTTKNKITENNVTLTYVKVEYTWGGRFFFIEDEPGVFRNISEQYYNRKVKK